MDGGDGCAIMSMHLMDYIFKSDLNGSFCYIYIYIYIHDKKCSGHGAEVSLVLRGRPSLVRSRFTVPLKFRGRGQSRGQGQLDH